MSMNCERVNDLLPDYFEGELPAVERAAFEAHVNVCGNCAAVIRDVEMIRREAAALPLLTPSRGLWKGIEQRISADVVPLESARTHVVHGTPGRAWMAAAAAALVTTAGVTYLVTSRGSSPAAEPSRVAVQTPVPGVTVEAPTATVPSEAGPAVKPTSGNQEATARGTQRLASSGTGRVGTRTNAVSYAGSIQAEMAYSHEIGILERMVTDRSSDLDSATVQIITRNLQVIDAAIAQSKAALARDPASRLLYDQLNHVLGKKVELLRTAVMLPSSS